MLEIGKIIDREYKTRKLTGCHNPWNGYFGRNCLFLDLYTDLPIPIVLTGSMRSFDEFGYDGLSNLISAILVALDPNSVDRRVLVCLNDEINSAVDVQNTYNRLRYV